MYVNIPVPSHGSVIGMEVDTGSIRSATFDPKRSIDQNFGDGPKSASIDRLKNPTKWTIVTGTTSRVFLLGNCFLLFFERLRLILYHIVDSFW